MAQIRLTRIKHDFYVPLESIDVREYKRSAPCQTNCIKLLISISNMFKKLLKVHKLAPSTNASPKPVSPVSDETESSVLKIVHAGGVVECYYMETPAVKILEKYPSFVLARPEVFRRPWDSVVVRPDKILTPGQKFFLVPLRTVKKLRRRIRKPDREVSVVNSFVSKSSIDVSVDSFSSEKDNFSTKSFCKRSEVSDSSEVSYASRKKTRAKKHVRFVGIEVKHNESHFSPFNDITFPL